ncbi:MAG TPA: hypothetical protein VGK24_05850 [Candidatus Angelobacter sp.]|jgi:hypothetical protein
MVEGAAPTGVVGQDILYADSSLHRPRFINNNGSPATVAFLTDIPALSGATNTITKFTSSSTIGNSSATDDGTTFTVPEKFTSKSENGLEIIHVDQYASWGLAEADCPSVGCILDGRSLLAPTAIGTFDPGTTAAVHILLGPQIYTLDHFVVRSGLEISGSGIENIQGTKIQLVGTGPGFIMPASVSAISVQGVLLHDFELEATAGNTGQDGMFFDVSASNLAVGSNFESSKIQRITFQNFKGSAVHIKGRIDSATSVVQFNSFELLNIIIPTGNTTIGSALRAEGAVGQNVFVNNIFGESASGGTLIYLGVTNTSDTTQPYSNWLYGSTIQGGDIGVLINGCAVCVFRDSHAEADKILFQFKTPTSVFNSGTLLDGGVANGNVGTNSGAGAIIDSSDASNATHYIAKLTNWTFNGTPDKVVNGISGGSSAIVQLVDNHFEATTPAPSTTHATPGYATTTTTLNIQNANSAFINGCSGGAITTITSALLPGEILTLEGNTACQFATGGNIGLGNNSSPITLRTGQVMQFLAIDSAGSTAWILIDAQPATRSQRFGSLCSTTAAAGSSCTTPVTWASAFADTNYTLTCEGVTQSNFPTWSIESITASGFLIRITAVTAAIATYASMHCNARHDP